MAANKQRVLFVYYDKMETDEALLISIIEPLTYIDPPYQLAVFSLPPPPPLSPDI